MALITMDGYIPVVNLPFPLNYVPMFFRLMAFLIAAPLAVFFALDLVAYAIARTLHISMSSLRVPRSPPQRAREIEDDDEGFESDAPIVDRLDDSYVSKARRRRAPWIYIVSVAMVAFAVWLQWFAPRANDQSVERLSGNVIHPIALVLTAHPDDEAMFFAPSILTLGEHGWDLHAVCLSDGDADGLGAVRKGELFGSYEVLGLAQDNVTLIQHAELQDSMDPSVQWDPKLVAQLIAPHLDRLGVTHLITFDEGGVTQHPNHVALASVHAALEAPRPRLLVLSTPNLLTKFTGPFWSLFRAVRDYAVAQAATHEAAATDTSPEPPSKRAPAALIASPAQYAQALRAMRSHASQLVWFRWLYVMSSRLMWVNELIDLGV